METKLLSECGGVCPEVCSLGLSSLFFSLWILIIVIQNVLIYKLKISAYLYSRSCRLLLNIWNLANIGDDYMLVCVLMTSVQMKCDSLYFSKEYEIFV